jgi:hypothetical protein
MPFAPATAKSAPTVTYNGKATSTDGTAEYGAASFKIKNRKLVAWNANEVPRQCQDLELMNYGFTVAPNVLKAYGLKPQDVKLSKQGRLKFTYTQPSHLDKITVNVKFGTKTASGSVINLAGPGETETQNCFGSAKVTLRK